MADYQKMYYIVCFAASRAIDAPPDEARRILRAALHEAEELYIDTCGEDDARKED